MDISRQSRRIVWIVPALFFMLTACSIKPLPEDVTNFTTVQIVTQIRCEMRDALRDYVAKYLKSSKEQRDIDAAARLESGSLLYKTSNRYLLSPHSQKQISIYDDALITYEYNFNIKENNNAGGGLTLTRPFSNGSDALGFGIRNDRERNNVRTLRVRETFKESIALESEACDRRAGGANYLHPITGSIGLFEQIDTFLTLRSQNILIGTAQAEKVPILADNIRFTTRSSASFSPSFVYGPLGPGFAISSALGTVDGAREDIHSVIVVLALPPEAPRTERTVVDADGRSRIIRRPRAASREAQDIATSNAIERLRVIETNQALQTLGNAFRR